MSDETCFFCDEHIGDCVCNLGLEETLNYCAYCDRYGAVFGVDGFLCALCLDSVDDDDDGDYMEYLTRYAE